MSGMTFAVSEEAFQTVFETLRDNVHPSGTIGPGETDVSAQLDWEIELKRGRVSFNSNNTITISELDFSFVKCDLKLFFDLDPIPIGGGTVEINAGFGIKFTVELPSWTLFEAEPDFEITIPAGELLKHLVHEVSFNAELGTEYKVSKARRRGKDYLEAHDRGDPNTWNVFLIPRLPIDIDLLDVADTVGDFLESAVEAAVDGLLGGLSDTVKNLVKDILGAVIDIIRVALDIGDDIHEWFENLINFDLDLMDHVLMAVVRAFQSEIPLHSIEDPYPILPQHEHKIVLPTEITNYTLCEVMVPVTELDVRVDADEMVIQGTIGEEIS
jgi:hypothetical protein